ncbi:uncharacterized protein LOC144450635 [Glandiceps talaboti]
MGNCAECCKALFGTKEEESNEPTKDPEDIKPVSAEPPTKQKTARKFGSTLIPRKTSSNEKTPLIEGGTTKHRKHDTSTDEGHGHEKKKSSFKKFKDKLTGKKSDKGIDETSEDSAHGESEYSTSSRPESPLSAADAARRAHQGTVERGEKLQNTEEVTASLASHCKRLSITAKMLADKKRSSSKKRKTEDLPE